jgi:hypothetical protein
MLALDIFARDRDKMYAVTFHVMQTYENWYCGQYRRDYFGLLREENIADCPFCISKSYFNIEDGGSKFFRNICKHLPEFTRYFPEDTNIHSLLGRGNLKSHCY